MVEHIGFGELGDLADPSSHCEPVDLGNCSTDRALSLYRDMVRIRCAEEAVAELVVSGEARCPCHLAIGQEAVPVGVAQALNSEDRSYGAHRSHGQYLALGGSMDSLLAEILGKDSGCSRGMGGSMHLNGASFGFGGSVPIVAGTIPVAVGAALAFKRLGKPNVGVAFFGDGACEEGVFHESLNLAAVMDLPVLFVVENNLFASHLDIHLRQASNRVSRFAEAHGIAHRTVDGNDVFAVERAALELVQSAREGGGPGFIEAITYRWRGHVGANEDIDVGLLRKPEDVIAWKKRDPVGRLRQAVETNRGIVSSTFDQIELELAEEVSQALAFARSGSYPDSESLLGRVYSQTAV